MTNAKRSSTAPHVILHELGWTDCSFLEDALEGLSKPQKALPCHYLYDSQGSLLFERICDLPEYYLSRAEIMVLRAHADDIAAAIGSAATLYELGSGSSRKTPLLLEKLEAPYAYVPIDIARSPLLDASSSIAAAYPQLRVEAAWGDYTAPHLLPPIIDRGRRAAFFPGSTIGNLPPRRAMGMLKLWRAHLEPGGVMVVGVDLKKSRLLLERAYNDGQGMTARFITNVLVRANRELSADFSIDAFDYEARYDADLGAMRMYLVSGTDQEVHIAGRAFYFARDERLHVEDSYKYARGEFAELAIGAGFSPQACYVDPKGLFSVHVLTA